MTGILNFDSNPLSRITIGSLEDMGYEVAYDTADEYTVANLNATDPECVCARRRELRFGHAVLELPLGGASRKASPGLGEEMREKAVNKGLNVLAERSAESVFFQQETSLGGGRKANYVSVVVRGEDGRLHSIIVQ